MSAAGFPLVPRMDSAGLQSLWAYQTATSAAPCIWHRIGLILSLQNLQNSIASLKTASLADKCVFIGRLPIEWHSLDVVHWKVYSFNGRVAPPLSAQMVCLNVYAENLENWNLKFQNTHTSNNQLELIRMKFDRSLATSSLTRITDLVDLLASRYDYQWKRIS